MHSSSSIVFHILFSLFYSHLWVRNQSLPHKSLRTRETIRAIKWKKTVLRWKPLIVMINKATIFAIQFFHRYTTQKHEHQFSAAKIRCSECNRKQIHGWSFATERHSSYRWSSFRYFDESCYSFRPIKSSKPRNEHRYYLVEHEFYSDARYSDARVRYSLTCSCITCPVLAWRNDHFCHQCASIVCKDYLSACSSQP